MSAQPDIPILPFRVIDLTDYTAPDQLYDSLEVLGTTLEAGCEWNTDEPEYADEVLILDALNRPVRLRIKDCVVVLCELYEREGWSEERVKAYVEQRRLHARWKEEQRQTGSWFGRMFQRWRRRKI